MKKVLFIATVVQKHINVFHLPFLKWFQNEGYKTYVAASNDTDSQNVNIQYCDEYFAIDFKRNPLHPKNLLAYVQLKKLIESQEFDIIHCHTPVGGLLGRLAARKTRKNGTKVFYTAHGFHFYKGAPLKNWLMYYPVEKLCSFLTDVLITINQEDYELAKRSLRAKKVDYVHGVGIDLSRFENIKVDRAAKRQEIGVPKDAFLMLSVGELNENKNHQVIIKALAKLDTPTIHYAIAGVGDKQDYLLGLAKELGVAEQVHLLGYRKDIVALNYSADVFCFPSFREGLSVSLMEAMACGLPCIVSRIRGNVDLIQEEGGEFFSLDDLDDCCQSIKKIYDGDTKNFGEFNRKKIENYSIENIITKMKAIYER